METITQLEEDLAKSRHQGILYEEAIEALHADLEQMEKENAQLKKVTRRLERQGGGTSHSVNMFFTGPCDVTFLQLCHH